MTEEAHTFYVVNRVSQSAFMRGFIDDGPHGTWG